MFKQIGEKNNYKTVNGGQKYERDRVIQGKVFYQSLTVHSV